MAAGSREGRMRKHLSHLVFQERTAMAKKVTCPLCGVDITGEDEDALVAAADAHGDENHGMRAPREMILSSAVAI